MKPASNTVRELLERARQHINCYAVAFAVPSQHITQYDYAQEGGNANAKPIIQRSIDSLLSMCRDQREPIVRNRVREIANGPLLCRFLVAPVHDEKAELIGCFVLFNRPTDNEFTSKNARLASRVARMLAKAVSLPIDPLTGLLTRAGFEQQVTLRNQPHTEHTSSALLYGDIDQLHVINDLWGFKNGDRAIALVGEKIRTALSADDVVASRLSGDRFTIFLPEYSLDRAQQLAERIRGVVAAAHFRSNAQPVQISMSWGVASLRAGEMSLDHGLAAAEVACKAAKDRGRNRVETYQDTDLSIIRRRDDMLVVGRLRTALDEGRFQIFGQPIAPLLNADSPRRYEMLVRMIDENDKLVLPANFMSSATRYQLLPRLDRHVIGDVLAKLRIAATRPGFKPIQVSLNLSGPTISEPDFADWLLEQVTHCGVPSDWIGFELTETAAIANLERAQSLIDRLSAKGCKFALDDFGTGLNSLAYLKVLNISSIKIDGSFIRDLLENTRSESLVRAIAHLANSMGIETVAEYVESSAICMRLIELGVQFGQGYALGRPALLDRILDPMSSLALAG